MTKHPDIQKISFTGSVATGKLIMAACAPTLKRVTLELGGNDASIVCPDVDIAKTAPGVVMGAMFNSGQMCVATKRIYIHSDIYEPMLKAMVEFAKSLKVGQGDEEGVMVGPIQNEMQYHRVKGFFEDSKKKGHVFAAGGENENEKGYFINPTIVDNPPSDSRVVMEEAFVSRSLPLSFSFLCHKLTLATGSHRSHATMDRRGRRCCPCQRHHRRPGCLRMVVRSRSCPSDRAPTRSR